MRHVECTTGQGTTPAAAFGTTQGGISDDRPLFTVVRPRRPRRQRAARESVINEAATADTECPAGVISEGERCLPAQTLHDVALKPTGLQTAAFFELQDFEVNGADARDYTGGAASGEVKCEFSP